MNAAKMKHAIGIVWSDLRAACYTVKDRDAEALLDRALAECEQGEREHRAMGRRWLAGTGTTPRYALSVHDAARCMMAQHVLRGFKRPKDWASVADIRRDCALTYAAHDAIVSQNRKPYMRALASQPACKTVIAIDYAGDVAL